MPRRQDESPLMRARVRQRQRRIVADHVAVGDDVDIQRARPPGHLRGPGGSRLRGLAAGQDRAGPAAPWSRAARRSGSPAGWGRRPARSRRPARPPGSSSPGGPHRASTAPCRFAIRSPRLLPSARTTRAGRTRPAAAASPPVHGRRVHRRVRRIVTVTSSKGCGTGACGLCTVISTSSTPGSARHAVASRSASVSMSLTGSPETMADSRSGQGCRSRRYGTGHRPAPPPWCPSRAPHR